MSKFQGFSEEFLAPWRERHDPFKSLLQRSNYLTKYSRNGETWTDTIVRVVTGNVELDPVVTQEEAEKLFHLFWGMKALPPGRGLWTGGVPGIPADARYNCWYTTIRKIDDWCWVANQLMLGGGVGVGLQEIDKLPTVRNSGDVSNCTGKGGSLVIRCRVNHPDFEEVSPDPNTFGIIVTVDDSREGWVRAIHDVLEFAYLGRSLTVDVSPVRERGKPIKTFGGIACGPGPLVHLLRSVWKIIRGAKGRQLTSVEALDITNLIGLCIKSGNVRRSALIALSSPNDQDFRNAKKDYEAVKSHRHTSNNSLAFQSWGEMMHFDWEALVDDLAVMGEPGIANLPLVRLTDPGAMGVNPCGEQFLEDREACNLGEVFPALIDDEDKRHEAFRLVTRYCMRQRLTPVADPTSDAVRKKNFRIGVAIGGLCDFEWTSERPTGPGSLRAYYNTCWMESRLYAKELGVNPPVTVTTVKPSGTISLLNGSSPGLHAPYAPFYIRRTRIAKNDPMAPAMIRAGVPHEDCIYDQTGKTWVFSFPCAAPGARAYVVSESIRDQFVRQVQVQEAWADNAVSATLTFQAHERAELVQCLKEFVPRLKSTSCLPKNHGYDQPPYEEITEEEYARLHGMINHDDPLVAGGDMEVEECSNGVCPVR